jgi:hypothetical protein
MYGIFLEAHRKVLALNGMTPEIRGDRAHGLHVFEHRIREAESELLRALQEEPDHVTNCLRLTMLYATTGRLDDALRTLERPGQPIRSGWLYRQRRSSSTSAEEISILPWKERNRAASLSTLGPDSLRSSIGTHRAASRGSRPISACLRHASGHTLAAGFGRHV